MRKTLLAILALLSVMTMTYAENAMYIYRNDGHFNAFVDSNIDSVTYSNIDTAGVVHQQYVTQLVYTPDSLFRIPLSAIDSVAFTDRPAPELKPGVYHLTAEHIPYLLTVDSLTLTFDAATPQSLLPGKGNVIVTDVFDAPLQAGFAGRAIEVTSTSSGVVIACESVGITDIYERLICAGSVKSESTADSTLIQPYSAGSIPFRLDPISHSFGPITVTNRPDARIDYNIFIEPGYHPSITMLLYHTHNVSATYNYESEGEHSPDDIILASVPAKLPYGLYARLDLGLFWEAAGKMALEVEAPYTISFVNGFSWNENGYTSVNRKIQSEAGTPTANMELSGTVTAGMFLRGHFGFLFDDLLSVNTALKSGLQLEAGYYLNDYDLTTIGQTGTVYNLLKDTQIKLNGYFAWDCGYNILGEEGEISIFGNPLKYEKTELINQWYLLPEFSDLTYTEGDDKTTAVFETTPSRDLLMPVTLGIGLTDTETGQNIGIQNNGISYRLQNEYPLNSVSGIFSGLATETEYEAYPVVDILGYELRATPTKTISIEKEEEEDITPGQEVDLGLPSGTIWAGWNVGATSPEERGDYYTWGDVNPAASDSYGHVKDYVHWVDSDSDGGWDQGEFVNIGTNINGTQYDVAHQEWGGAWRMPTKEDFDELFANCTWVQYDCNNGLSGYKLIGPNGNSIFLPESELRWDFLSIGYSKAYGDYWSASLYEDAKNARAWGVDFSGINSNADYYNYCARHNRLLVRPVK